MKNQALFSSKDKSKNLQCLLQFLFGALRVKFCICYFVCFCAFRNRPADNVNKDSLFLYISDQYGIVETRPVHVQDSSPNRALPIENAS